MSKLRDLIKEFFMHFTERKYDVRFFTAIVFLTASLLTISINRGIRYDLREGETASFDIQLPRNTKIIDYKKTEEALQHVKQEIIPVFIHETSVRDSLIKEMDTFFEEAFHIVVNENLTESERMQSLRQLNTNIPVHELLILKDRAAAEKLHDRLTAVTKLIYNKGYMKLSDLYLFHNMKNIDIFEQDTGHTRPGTVEEFVTAENMNLTSLVTQGGSPPHSEELRVLREYLKVFLRPDVYYDIQRTAMKMNDEIARTEPVYMNLKKGRLIIRKGEEISREKINLITEINKKIRSGQVLNIAAIFLSYVIIFIFFRMAFQAFEPNILHRRNYYYIFLTLGFAWFLLTFFLSQATLPAGFDIPNSVLIPIAFISLAFPVFFSFSLSVAAVVLLTFVSGLLFQNEFIQYLPVFFAGLAGVFIGYLFNKRRTKLWLIAIYLLLCQLAFILVMDFFIYLPLRQVLQTLLIGTINVFVSLIGSLALVAILEAAFNATTDSRLLEFSDLNKPIFKQMLLEAPGTYHHSILVANLAEAAAQEINANSLLVKVAAYYHDIGKLSHPDFYIENSGYKSKMEEKDVKPTLYVSIVKQHLKESVELGRKLRLPEEVIEVMSQHHGRSLIKFFYFKALNMAKKTDADLSKEDFKYDGDNPNTREAVILLLADSVEAASRSLSNPSYQNIRDQVEEILNSKFAEGLLSDSSITLGEIKKIGKAFVKVFVGVFHSRIKYPDDEEIKQAEHSNAESP